jgi:hypothetical protein
MADLDTALQREKKLFHEQQMAWAVEDAQFRLKQSDADSERVDEVTSAVA